MTKIDRAKIAAYSARNSGEKFRISREGDVHILGQMPNSVVRGWWFAGYASDILTQLDREA